MKTLSIQVGVKYFGEKHLLDFDNYINQVPDSADAFSERCFDNDAESFQGQLFKRVVELTHLPQEAEGSSERPVALSL